MNARCGAGFAPRLRISLVDNGDRWRAPRGVAPPDARRVWSGRKCCAGGLSRASKLGDFRRSASGRSGPDRAGVHARGLRRHGARAAAFGPTPTAAGVGGAPLHRGNTGPPRTAARADTGEQSVDQTASASRPRVGEQRNRASTPSRQPPRPRRSRTAVPFAHQPPRPTCPGAASQAAQECRPGRPESSSAFVVDQRSRQGGRVTHARIERDERRIEAAGRGRSLPP